VEGNWSRQKVPGECEKEAVVEAAAVEEEEGPRLVVCKRSPPERVDQGWRRKRTATRSGRSDMMQRGTLRCTESMWRGRWRSPTPTTGELDTQPCPSWYPSQLMMGCGLPRQLVE
jgi:hypothetical protein